MTTVYEIPTAGSPKIITVTLPSGTYFMRLIYADSPNGEGGWLLDIGDQNGNPLVCGIPLVTGCDLLEQYAYLGIGGPLYCITAGDPTTPPTFSSLGSTSNLFIEEP